MTIEFGTRTETCRKIIQDISLYYEKCSSFCGSNDCPATTPYYRDPDTVTAKCVSDCPHGYTESGNNCVITQLCHSTCGTCSTKNDPGQCSTCSSTFSSSFAYNTLTPPGSCSFPATHNAQLLMTVNKNTILGTTNLKNITYNSATQSTSGSALSTLASLYVQNVI